MPDPAQTLRAAEERLFALHALPYDCRMVKLRDPALQVAVRFVGQGAPLLLVHGSGMSAATWPPLLEHLPGRRWIAVDLPGFGLSDRHSYAGRSLRQHAVAQLTSILDALDLASVELVGTSLGAMWSLCLAVDVPERVDGVVALGVPAASLPGMKGDTYFRLRGAGRHRGASAEAEDGGAGSSRHARRPRSPGDRRDQRRVLGGRACRDDGARLV